LRVLKTRLHTGSPTSEAFLARRHNDPARTREQTLSKATEEFARLGFEGGRVDRIAARCNLSKNMLYYYFESKEGLFVAVLERMYERLRNRQKDLALRTSEPVAALEQSIRHTLAALCGDPRSSG
jgi:TetR/AcrR family transcriptional regulator